MRFWIGNLIKVRNDYVDIDDMNIDSKMIILVY